MSGSRIARRQARSHARMHGRNDINIVPMLDVMIILIFFLIFTAVFSKMNILELNLPLADGPPQVPSLATPQGAQPSTASPSAATPLKRVQIVNFAFDPVTITITKGTRVRWTNAGSVNHTSTSNKGVWDSGSIAAGGRFSRLFKKLGTFRYHCSIHPTQMHGKIVVT